MAHSIHHVSGFEIVGPYTLAVHFDDDTSQTIEFRPVLEGEMLGPLQDIDLFNQVAVDPEAHTLVWPNGADFDPETLHDWPRYEAEFVDMARRWARTTSRSRHAGYPPHAPDARLP